MSETTTYPKETFSLKHKHSEMLAEQNDAFRKRVLEVQKPDVEIVQLNAGDKTILVGPHGGGIVNYTIGFKALDPLQQTRVIEHIRKQDEFEEGNDPYGEHDFGSVQIAGYPKIFWKISYYSGRDMQYGTDTPQAPSTFRVLTVMLAEEY